MFNIDSPNFIRFLKIAALVDAIYAAAMASIFSTIVYSLYGLGEAPASVTSFGTVATWLLVFIVAAVQGAVTIAVLSFIAHVGYKLIKGDKNG